MAQPARDTPAPAAALTVAELLAEPVLRNTLVAGTAGTAVTVRWCLPLAELDPTDVDIAYYATSAAIRGEQDAVVARVVAAHGVALLVRLGADEVGALRDVGDTLAVARRAADAAGLPFALLPPGVDFRTVSQLVATKVLAQTTHVLEYSDRVHRALGEILARGAGMSSLAFAMARMATAWVVVLDGDGAVLAHEGAHAPPQVPAPVSALLAAHLEGLLAAPVTGVATLEEPVAGTGPLLVAPVWIGGEVSGVVAVVEPSAPDPHDTAQRRVVAEEGAVLVGSEMLRLRSIAAAEERTRGDFVVDLVHGRFADARQLQARARHHRFAVDGLATVYVAEFDPAPSDDARSVRRMAAAARAVEHVDPPGAPASRAPALATMLGGHLVLVRPVDDADEPAVREVGAAVRKVLLDRLGGGVRVAFGRLGSGAPGVAESYREARTALALGRRVDVAPVAGYDDLKTFVALQDLADSDRGRRFAEEVLVPLRRADGHTGDLESVALAYVAESGNLNAAARRLGLHRNTALYKLDRVSRALAMDIRSADTQFTVWLAHHLDTLGAVNRSLDAELEPPL